MTKHEKGPIISYVDMDKFKGSNYEIFDVVLLNIVDTMLQNKYRGFRFYCHNFGGYDCVFVLGVLLRYNDINPLDEYKIDCVYRDKHIIKMTISKNAQKVMTVTR